MCANLFAKKIDMNRKSFRYILEHDLREVYYKDEKIDFKEWILRECFGDCCSEFEEQVMVENLKEEFQDYMNSLLSDKEPEA